MKISNQMKNSKLKDQIPVNSIYLLNHFHRPSSETTKILLSRSKKKKKIKLEKMAHRNSATSTILAPKQIRIVILQTKNMLI